MDYNSIVKKMKEQKEKIVVAGSSEIAVSFIPR